MCSVWCPKKNKKIIKLCSASRMTFRARFYRTDPQNIGGQFETLSGFLRNTFRKQTSQRKPRNIFQTEKFQDYFWETRTSLFLGGSAFRFGEIYILFHLPSTVVFVYFVQFITVIQFLFFFSVHSFVYIKLILKKEKRNKDKSVE